MIERIHEVLSVEIEREIARLRDLNKIDMDLRRDILDRLPGIVDENEYRRLVAGVLVLNEDISQRCACVRLWQFKRRELERGA